MRKTRRLLILPLFLWASCLGSETEEVISQLPDGEHTLHYSSATMRRSWRGRRWGHGRVKDGKQEGPWTLYYPNNFPKMKTTYVKGVSNGLTTYYWNRGWFRERGMMRDGERVGAWESWQWGEASDVR